MPQYFLPVRYNYSRSIAHLFTEGQGPGGGGGGGGERGDAESEKECVICYNVIEETARGSSDYMVCGGCGGCGVVFCCVALRFGALSARVRT